MGSRNQASPCPPSPAAGKSLEQVRASARAAASALNQTLHILNGVSRAVQVAKHDHMHEEQIREVRLGLYATITI